MIIPLSGCPDNRADSSNQREYRRDDLPPAIFLVFLLILGFHIHNVILLQIEAGRLEKVGTAQVVHEHLPFAIRLADDRHPVYLCIYGKVTRIGDGFQQSNAITVRTERAVSSDSA